MASDSGTAAAVIPATRARSLVSAKLLLWAAIAAYAAGFAALSILRHRAFSTGRFDLGNMVQAVWSTAHGHFLQVTGLHGHNGSRLGVHFDPILAAFAPLWRLSPSPDLLLTAQAILVALGALPVFWLAHKHVGSERAGLGFALAYLLYPPVEWLTLNEFHPVSLACPFLLFAFWYLDEDRLVPFAIFALLACTTKEEIALVVAAMGVWYALAHGRRLAGAAIAVLGTAATGLILGVVIPHFRQPGASSFYGRYQDIGGSPGGVARTVVTHPLRVLEIVLDHRGVHYLLDLGLPLAGLFLLSPLTLLVALPELALNMLSRTPAQTSIHFHYTAGEIPGLVAASVLGAAWLSRRAPRWAFGVAAVALVAAIAGNYAFGPIPLWRYVPGGSDFQANRTDVDHHDRVADRALRLIPASAVVSATNTLGAHLSARPRILSFPVLQDATWVAYDRLHPSYEDKAVAPVLGARSLARLRQDPRWKLVFHQSGILLFRRR
jgi:uncharacterized membrane protein